MLIVGYQSHGSLGRRLVEGREAGQHPRREDRGEGTRSTPWAASARTPARRICCTWFSAIAPSKPRVILTHGEDEPRGALAKKIQQQFRLPSKLPKMGDVIEL